VLATLLTAGPASLVSRAALSVRRVGRSGRLAVCRRPRPVPFGDRFDRCDHSGPRLGIALRCDPCGNFGVALGVVAQPCQLNLVGEGQIIFGSDMPHGDRERRAARMLQERGDISASAKESILDKNPARLYGIA